MHATNTPCLWQRLYHIVHMECKPCSLAHLHIRPQLGYLPKLRMRVKLYEQIPKEQVEKRGRSCCRHMLAHESSALDRTLRQLYAAEGGANAGSTALGSAGHIMYSDEPPVVEGLSDEDSFDFAFTQGKGVMVSADLLSPVRLRCHVCRNPCSHSVHMQKCTYT